MSKSEIQHDLLMSKNTCNLHQNVLDVSPIGYEVSPLIIAKDVKFAVNLIKKYKICAQCNECCDKKLLSAENFFQRLCGEKKFN